MEMRIIAGILLIISFVCGLYTAVPLLIAEDLIQEAESVGMPSFLSGIFMTCAIIVMIFALLALLGGVMAITGKSFGLAILGAVFAMFTLGPIFLGSLLGLVALILLALSKDEFGGGVPMPPPGAYGNVPPAMPMGMDPLVQPAQPYGQPPMQQPPADQTPPMEQPPAYQSPPMDQPPAQPPREQIEEQPREQAPAYQSPPAEVPPKPPEEPQP